MPKLTPDGALCRRSMLAGTLALVLASGTAVAEVSQQTVDGAVDFMQKLAAEAIQILQRSNGSLEQREQEFRRLLRQGFDMDFIGRFALGKHWRRASPEERREYQDLFSEYVVKTYSRRLGGYAGETFEIRDARAVGKQDVLVSSRIQQPSGPPILADWRIREVEGQYKVIDVMVEGVSMVITQRDEFNTVVSQQGMAGLLQALRARTQMFGTTS